MDFSRKHQLLNAAVPVEKLRDKAWVEAHSHTPSIID
jgi:hypothetical protein